MRAALRDLGRGLVRDESALSLDAKSPDASTSSRARAMEKRARRQAAPLEGQRESSAWATRLAVSPCLHRAHLFPATAPSRGNPTCDRPLLPKR